ncbi:ABC transporter permease [Microlunatus antarcticus]|uniref:Putative aldouronate transport system permease protein n=1 Tax=Microlunatus antarcticus TaxID=53388 RepID=A0A7W5JVV5_9ACTN|nr:putative aldouronate transport system permease protein [Microlunatus antarcticus]
MASTVVQRPRQGWRARLRRDRVLLAMTIPGLVALVGFHYLPLLGNVIAFEDYQPFLGIINSQWVGFEKFAILFNGDPAFVNAVKNTLILTLVQVIFVFPAPIVLALMINSLLSDRMRRIVQNVLYLPHFLSWVVVVAIFQQLLGGSGLLNTFLRSHGAATLDIVGNPDLFISLLTSQVVWKDSGWATILFLAALSQVDQSLYEASAIDGASRAQQLVNVTLPALRGVIILLLILRLGDSLNVGFEQIILQQKAVGSEASEVIDTYVFNYGILGSDWGTSAAVGLVKGVIATVLVVGANKLAHVFGEDGVYRA